LLLWDFLLNSFKLNNGQVEPPDYQIRTIVIDAGHGGKDTGAAGRRSLEKNVALEVALKLGKQIQKDIPGIKIVYTRTTDEFVELYKRIRLANANKADLFISIHCNSSGASAHGTETLVSGSHRLGQQDAAVRENASLLLESNYKENYQGFDPKDPESAIIFSLMKNRFREKVFVWRR
jgi:N-acetylmuramoyl-L-alanine amidase